MRALEITRAVVRKCVSAMAIVAMLGIVGMMLSITYDVFARFMFAAPTDWAYPLNALGVLSTTLLTVPYLYVERQHIAMDLVHRALPPKLRAATNVVTAVATGLLGLVIIVAGSRSMLVAIDTGLTGSGTFNIPFWVHDTVLVTTGLFLTVVATLFPAAPAANKPDTAVEEHPPEPVQESEAV